MNYNFPEELLCDAAMVRTNQINTSGYGEIGTLSLVVIDNIAGKTTTEDIEFNIIDIRAINVDMDELSVVAVGTIFSTGINGAPKTSIDIFPNPVTGNYFNSDSGLLINSVFRRRNTKLSKYK